MFFKHLNNKLIQIDLNKLCSIGFCSFEKDFFFVFHRSTIKEREPNRTGLEGQIEYLISMNTDQIREQLNRFDRSHTGTITNEQMKSLIEDLLEFPLRPDEYQTLFKSFPVDSHGLILYEDYLREILQRFDQRDFHSNDQISKFDKFVFFFFGKDFNSFDII